MWEEPVQERPSLTGRSHGRQFRLTMTRKERGGGEGAWFPLKVQVSIFPLGDLYKRP